MDCLGLFGFFYIFIFNADFSIAFDCSLKQSSKRTRQNVGELGYHVQYTGGCDTEMVYHTC